MRSFYYVLSLASSIYFVSEFLECFSIRAFVEALALDKLVRVFCFVPGRRRLRMRLQFRSNF